MRRQKWAVLAIVCLILVSTQVYAAGGMFDGIVDLLNDVFAGIGDIFSLGIWQNPATALGFLLFLLWVMLVTILNLAVDKLSLFRGNTRQVKVISVIIATMTIIFLNFERRFLVLIIGNWLIWIYFLLVFGGLGALIFFAYRNNWNHWIRAFILFIALMVSMAAKGDVEAIIKALEQAANAPTFAILLIPIKWQSRK